MIVVGSSDDPGVIEAMPQVVGVTVRASSKGGRRSSAVFRAPFFIP